MLRAFIISLIILFSASSLFSTADAKRFGGGSSFGMKRNVSSFPHSNSASASRLQQPAAAAAAAAPSAASKWLGPLAGLAAGGLLASLFMGHGVGSGMLSWLLVIGAGLMLWRFIGARSQPTAQFQSQAAAVSPANSYSPALDSGSNVYNLRPAVDFDEAQFLRQTKSLFIRLQTAYDTKNLADIREFTTPEVFAEIQLQLQERGDQANVTEVVNLNSEFLERADDARGMIASVLFSGSIREEQNAEPVNIKEIWHFLNKNSNWIVAGIQQV